MLLRRDDHGILAIGQPSHAWVSGQLARAWGNDRFGAVSPHEEVCLAAEQHDIGMAVWDLEPSFNPQTGLPHSFIEMPLAVHIELWREAAPRLVRQSRFAALLTSMHGVRLYEMRDLAKLEPADAERVTAFFDQQRAFQADLIASLGAQAEPAIVKRASDQLWTWDYLSLALCLDWAPCTATHVPTADGDSDVRVEPDTRVEPDAGRVTLDPWPFAGRSLTVRCEGQRLDPAGYANENELRAALGAAAWETLTIELAAPERSA